MLYLEDYLESTRVFMRIIFALNGFPVGLTKTPSYVIHRISPQTKI